MRSLLLLATLTIVAPACGAPPETGTENAVQAVTRAPRKPVDTEVAAPHSPRAVALIEKYRQKQGGPKIAVARRATAEETARFRAMISASDRGGAR